jgi:hypothetical protein
MLINHEDQNPIYYLAAPYEIYIIVVAAPTT